MDSLRHRLEVAREAAWLAGRLTLRYFRSGLEVERKGDESPVTRADRETEAFLIEYLGRYFPKDAILGEESEGKAGDSGYRWYVDPIDGTRSFIHGMPLYTVLVGLLDPAGEAVVGVVAAPALDELVAAARGEGCLENGRRARVSEIASLAEACVTFTGQECFRLTGTEAVYEEVAGRARLLRGWGDAYGHVLVATGRAEVMLDPILNDWDTVALQPVVEEAGGVFTDWSGRRDPRGKSGVSTNARVSEELRALLP